MRRGSCYYFDSLSHLVNGPGNLVDAQNGLPREPLAMRPSQAQSQHRDAICLASARYRVANPSEESRSDASFTSPSTSQMAKRQAHRVAIFAGPNRAGKSTHADAIAAALGINTFVNADCIARGFYGRNADATVAMQASRIMLTRLKALAAARQDFAFESTLSSRSFAPFLSWWKARGDGRA